MTKDFSALFSRLDFWALVLSLVNICLWVIAYLEHWLFCHSAICTLFKALLLKGLLR